MTIHGSELELKRLRYLENRAKRVGFLLDAITFDPSIGISFCQVFWKLDIHKFLKTLGLAQSESIKAFKCSIKIIIKMDKRANRADKWPFKSCQKLKGQILIINALRPPSTEK